MQRIEKALKEQIHEICLYSLEGAIYPGTGLDSNTPICHCNRINENYDIPIIKEFMIGCKIYTPTELYQAFINYEHVSHDLKKVTLDRVCNYFSLLGNAAKNERPLYTKNRSLERPLYEEHRRSEFCKDKRLDGNYKGDISNAIIGFSDYLIAEIEDIIKMDKLDDWTCYADKDFAMGCEVYIGNQNYFIKSGMQPEMTQVVIDRLEYLDQILAQIENYPHIEGCIQRKKDYSLVLENPDIGLYAFKKELLVELKFRQLFRQMVLDDNENAIGLCYGNLYTFRNNSVSCGIYPAIEHLIRSYTHKTEGHFH